MKIAIIGAGIAGLAAARRLQGENEVAIYDAEARPGGHCRTETLDIGESRIAVDTGFIVYNEFNYPRLTRLFAELDVPTHPTCMSFGVSADDGRAEWSSRSFSGLFADRARLLHPSFLNMLADVARFNRHAVRDLASGAARGHSLESYLGWRGLGERFRAHYLIPMGAAIWCMPDGGMLRVPAESFLEFFDNHGLLRRNRRNWRTVAGGSAVYVDRLVEPYRAQLRLNCPVTGVRRAANGVNVIDRAGAVERFDRAILACHSDTALSLLDDADTDERRILGALRYIENEVWLHGDASLMPRRHAAWSSWNVIIPRMAYVTGAEAPRFGVTYWMNSLQQLPAAPDIFVSVNPSAPPRAELTYARFGMDHPSVDWRSIAARKALESIQGRRHVWFCGAWTGSGFHEDGLVSGERAAAGVSSLAAPGRAQPPPRFQAAG